MVKHSAILRLTFNKLLKKVMRLFSLMGFVFILSACGGGSSASNPVDVVNIDEEQHLSGGQTSVANTTVNAFSQKSNNIITVDRQQSFALGNDFFEQPWVAGSASTSSRDGLGGLFNNNACQDCHIRDGRGHAPEANSNDFNSILFRAAKTNITTEQEIQMLNGELANVGDSSVGGQLQQFGVSGVTAEVDLAVQYQYSTVTFTDGFEVELRQPIWQLTSKDTSHDFDDDTVFSPRIAPPMIGLGLLALVSEQDIVTKEDITDSDNNGISGKANYVWSLEANQKALGRFGWKAGQPSLIEQAAGAFVNDMGLTNRLHLQESCLEHQSECLTAQNGNGDSVNDYAYEVPDIVLDAIAFYSSHLAVPKRRNAYSNNVLSGQALFKQAGCQGCHTPSYITEYSTEQPELSEQKIFPYTDLLLHDMGSALADFTLDNENNNQPATRDAKTEYAASAHEWRTPPLWGLGLATTVDSNANFLHDGRARTIMEAVLWHGGEAEKAKQVVLQFTARERANLLAFLDDL